ncbi:efflux RND transporter periplasmic adaptor subunit, partial [Patescibacteria group bacterium]|nr:efflux RND transporter periplasmic adaptor subunit [Patescibacteria group bacterium]
MHPRNKNSQDSLDEILERRKKSKKWKRFLSKKILVPIGIAIVAPFVFGYFLGDSNDKVSESEVEIYEVTKTNLETIVSSSGNVVAEDGVSVSFSTTNEQITAVYVKEGDMVSAGDKLATIDTTDLNLDLKSAQNSLNTAYANLQETLDGATETEIAIQQKSLDSAKANFEKTLEDNEFSIQQAEIKLANLQKDLDSITSGSAETDSTLEAIEQAYENALLKVDSVLIDIKNSLDAADEILDDENDYSLQLGSLNSALLRSTENAFKTLKSNYKNLLNDYVLVSATSGKLEVVAKIDAAIDLTSELANAFDSLYDVFENTSASAALTESEIASFQSSASSYQSKMSTDEQSLISSKQTINSQVLSKSEKIDSLEDDIEDAKINLAEAKKSAARSEASAQNSLDVAELNYLKLTEPATTVELATLRAQINSAQINVTKIKNQIAEATLTAPIDGEIVELNGQVGDLIIQDQNETFATILNKDTFFIEVSIEEVEVNQIKKGQRVIATFDAIENTEVNGEVSFVSLMSTTSGGIVTYSVRITLKDWGEVPIREGMTAYVDFVVGEARDVLAIPVSAVVSRDEKSFVSMDDGSSREIETGFNDGSLVEIKSGLVEGEKIIA